jgi:hypothetical protein
MRPRVLLALTWVTVAAAVFSALWLAWTEAGRGDFVHVAGLSLGVLA